MASAELIKQLDQIFKDAGITDAGRGVDETEQERLTRLANEIESGNRTLEQITTSINRIGELRGELRKAFQESGVSIATDDETSGQRLTRLANEAALSVGRSQEEIFSAIERLGRQPSGPGSVLAGGQTIKVGSQWYQVYEFPAGSGEFMSFRYNNREQAEAALGEDFAFSKRSQTWLDNRAIVQANAEEVIGQTGHFQRLTRELMQDAAAAAGVRDPSLVGRIASNREMQQIMAQAIAGDWTPEQILAEQRKTRFWKNELYPGIESFYDVTNNPEGEWREYRDSVTPALRQLGYEPDAGGSFNRQIRKMLNNKVDAQTFLQQVPTFIRAKQDSRFATILDQWADRELGRNIDFNDWFDLVGGEGIPELERVAERAQLEWVAQNQGTELTQGDIKRISNRSQLSPEEAQRAFSEFNQQILAIGESGLGRYGLTRDKVLSAAIGVAPSSGQSVDEVKLLVAKVAREEALFDDEKINFYVGFDPSGRPTRPGLQSLAPEGA